MKPGRIARWKDCFWRLEDEISIAMERVPTGTGSPRMIAPASLYKALDAAAPFCARRVIASATAPPQRARRRNETSPQVISAGAPEKSAGREGCDRPLDPPTGRRLVQRCIKGNERDRPQGRQVRRTIRPFMDLDAANARIRTSISHNTIRDLAVFGMWPLTYFRLVRRHDGRVAHGSSRRLMCGLRS